MLKIGAWRGRYADRLECKIASLVVPGGSVLEKCANPVCPAQFRYLQQGRLFELAIQCLESLTGEGNGKLRNGERYAKWMWLCDQCALQMAPRIDARRGVVMESLVANREVAVIAALQQFVPESAGRVARVWIHPLRFSDRHPAAISALRRQI